MQKYMGLKYLINKAEEVLLAYPDKAPYTASYTYMTRYKQILSNNLYT